jgi:hypothetical protein
LPFVFRNVRQSFGEVTYSEEVADFFDVRPSRAEGKYFAPAPKGQSLSAITATGNVIGLALTGAGQTAADQDRSASTAPSVLPVA